MSKFDAIPGAPTPDEVRETLERIVTSEVFRSSPQLASFLNFVVEAVLHGKSDRIKGYVIGVEVLRRDIKFDPQLDPIVRVEATRLRRALERYYTGPGQNEPVIIDLPRGSYVPTFRHRGEALPDPDQPVVAPRIPRWLLAAGISALVVLLAATAIFFAVRQNKIADIPGFRQSTGVLPPGNGMPTLVIQAFETVGMPDPRVVSATTLLEKVRDALAAFDGINVVTGSDRPDGKTDYRLRGLLEYPGDGTAIVRFSLTDALDGTVVWSRSFDRMPLPRDRAAIENSIGGKVSAELLQPFGVIKARDRAKFLARGGGDPRYRCLLLTADSFRSFDPDQSARARTCLESLTKVDDSFADGFSYLASLSNREYVYGFGKGADDASTLDRALQLARRSIELNPNSARSWQVLSTVLFSRHEIAAAFAAVQKALALNPNDMIIVAEYGGRLITTGDFDRGVEILQRAGGDSVRPSWHHFYFFLADYMRGRLAEASHEADEMTSDTYTHGLFARALIASLEGKPEKAASAWRKLVALRPAWRDNPRGELEKYISAKPILDRLMRDFERSGLAQLK